MPDTIDFNDEEEAALTDRKTCVDLKEKWRREKAAKAPKAGEAAAAPGPGATAGGREATA